MKTDKELNILTANSAILAVWLVRSINTYLSHPSPLVWAANGRINRLTLLTDRLKFIRG